MYLSNRLTFSIFSLLLVAALVLVTTPAMAQETVSYYATKTDETAEADGKWEVFFKFDMGGSFPNKNVFTSFTTADPPVKEYNISLGGTPLTEAQFNAATYGSNKLTVPIAKNAGAPTNPTIAFTVQGYDAITATAVNIAEADAVNLVVATDHLAGKAYRVYARTAGSTNKPSPDVGAPHLPTGVDAVLFPQTVSGTVNADLPADFEEFFMVGGGTIDLKLTNAAANGATAITKNSRHIIINEIMWGVDNSQVGQPGYTHQQWIEVYNTTSIPVPDAGISFAFEDDTFPATAIADGTSDRISNIGGYQNVWRDDNGNSTMEGSSGTATRNDAGTVITGANPQFVSLYRSKPGDDGIKIGSWTESGRAYFPGFLGTPGSANTRGGLPTPRKAPGATNPPKDKIVINEIGKSGTANADWIELRNVTGSAQPLKNYSLTTTTGFGNETEIYDFPEKLNNIPVVIPANGVLLLLNSQPSTNDHARGFDITKTAEFQDHGVNAESHRYLVIPGNKIQIPNGDAWLLILRTHPDNKFHQSSHQIHDVAGPGGGHGNFTKVEELGKASPAKDKKGDGNAGGNIWHTRVFPLNGQTAGAKDNLLRHNHAAANIPLGGDNAVWKRDTGKGGGQGWKHQAFSKADFSGIGYDRSVTANAENSGTPGYQNNLQKGKVGDIADGKVIISELMLTQGRRSRDPQWIELYNTSRTNTVNLDADDGWRLVIENHDSDQWEGKRDLVRTINFKAKDDVKRILPNQTILVVSTTSTRVSQSASNRSIFPSQRVYDVYQNNRGEFYMDSRNDPFLNTNGFHIKLVDGKGTMSDEVGNLDGNNRTYDDPPDGSWDWPAEHTDDDARTSLMRIMNGGTRGVPSSMLGTVGTPRDATPLRAVEDNPETTDMDETVEADLMRGAVLPMGSKVWRGKGKTGTGEDMLLHSGKGLKYAWVHAVDTAFDDVINTYYGSQTDIGTPGHITGKPLPVNLSFFRPTLEDGKVVVRWTTESELDNAGFNILRSDTRNGEFKQVNAQLIQGKGTTAERSTYKWVDTSAKPGAVYYYQIEDVSFAGERSTLTTTKLKGLISAKNKLTTKWGELKEVQ